MRLVSTPTLYVHVADDGGILAVDGESGLSAWLVLPELARRLGTLRTAGGSLLLSHEPGSPVAAPALALIRGYGMPIVESANVHPDAVRAGGVTTLMFAAYVGAEDLAQDLVSRGTDLEQADEEGFTALMYAANAGQERIAQLLIDAGADVGRGDGEGSTALMFAAQHGQLTIVKKLLAAGADVRARRGDGLTARAFAIRNGHERVAAILLTAERQVS